jgi:hypothetical protein
MRMRLKICILKSLLAADGVPMPEASLIGAVQTMARPVFPTDGDVIEALKEAERELYCAGVTDDLTGRSWTLTEKGVHKARKL